MSKHSTIMNKKWVDLLVNWNIYVETQYNHEQNESWFTWKLEYFMSKYSTILNKKWVDLLVNWNIYVETQYNLEQKESWFTCKLEYFMSKYSTILNKKRIDLLVYLHMYFQTWICYAWNKKRVKGHIKKVLHKVVNSLLYDRSLLHKYILYVADPP